MTALRDLRVEHLLRPLGLSTPRPRFSWIIDASGADIVQEAYEIEVRREAEETLLWGSGVVASADSVLVPFGGNDLSSATQYRWRVRASTQSGWTDWAHSDFETALLDRSDWIADFVEPDQPAVTPDGLRRKDGDWIAPPPSAPEDRLHPAQYLRQKFHLAGKPVRARLYSTARGVYTAEVNGAPVGDQVLAPGYDSYNKILAFQTYDVSSLLSSGQNVLGAILGDGWYAGRIDFTGTSAQYGNRLQAGWQLVVDFEDGGRQVIVSDESVVSCADGGIRYSDIFIGESYDARRAFAGWSTSGFDDSDWTPAHAVDAPVALFPFIGEPVRRVENIAVRDIIVTPAGDTVLDFGQVIAGVVRMTVQGPAGTQVKLEHSEVLDRDGNFFNNTVGLNKDQTDFYVTAGADHPEVWQPLFTFHGFRFVRVTGFPGELLPDNFQGVVIGSDLETTGEFSCSDPRITQLHQNAVWSQRGNFLSIPTDCPQRERMGWTGDLQVFAPAATRNRMVTPFLARWLNNVRADQDPDGTVSVIVPASPFMGSLSETLKDDPLLSIRAAAGWGDAMVLVPWVLYERYGDLRVLEDNYSAMKAWVDRQIRVAEAELPPRLRDVDLTAEQLERQSLLWNSEPNFGDWLAPSVVAENPSLEHMLSVAVRSGEPIAAMFHGWSLEVLGKAAHALGHESDGDWYLDRARLVREAFADEYIDSHGRFSFDAQGTYVLALALGFVPQDKVAASLARLVELINEAHDHLDTGFLSVPHLLDVLWTNGERELARTLLWQDSSPSWLYEVDRGATTIWEAWEGIKPNGEVMPVSFNHYAFGCVDEWLYARLAGIQSTSPGYKTIAIEPDFGAPLDWVEAKQDTPYGLLEVRWDREASDPHQVSLSVLVPANTTASVILPADAQLISVSSIGTRRSTDSLERVGSGHTSVSFRLNSTQVRSGGLLQSAPVVTTRSP
ncbi:MAG: family 78 glycoside hydrolase catalytic domain [Lacisediminihabitans sp.]